LEEKHEDGGKDESGWNAAEMKAPCEMVYCVKTSQKDEGDGKRGGDGIENEPKSGRFFQVFLRLTVFIPVIIAHESLGEIRAQMAHIQGVDYQIQQVVADQNCENNDEKEIH